MKVGAELRLGGDVGELFADARALEAAGADTLWVVTHDDEDPWTLAAALAATTWRARLVVVGAVERAAVRVTPDRPSRGRRVTCARCGESLPGAAHSLSSAAGATS